MNTLSIQPRVLHQDKLIQAALERIRQLESEVQYLQRGAKVGQYAIRIHQGNRLITVSTSEILYVKAEDNYSRIYVNSGEQYYTSRTLKSWVKELPEEEFVRCHRTFLVNRKEVAEINRASAEIILRNTSRIPTSRRFQKNCLESLFGRFSADKIQHEASFPVIHKLPVHQKVSGNIRQNP